MPLKAASALPQIGKKTCYLPWWLYFKGMASRFLRKSSLVVKLVSGLGEGLSAFQRGREWICNYRFSEVTALRKGRPGKESQDKPFWNLSLWGEHWDHPGQLFQICTLGEIFSEVQFILIENSVIFRYMFMIVFREKIRPEQGLMNEGSPERSVR